MKNTFKISIPNPCSQNWDEMKPCNNGRFCSSCEKTVTDFTKMDDAAFIAYFQNHKKASCGRFTERQLSLAIPFRSKPLLPLWKVSKYVAASMITVAGLSGKVFGQKAEIMQTLDSSPESKTEKAAEHTEKYIAVGGIVFDDSGDPLIGASVSLQHSEVKTMTDINGKFFLLVPQSLLDDGFAYLNINYIGFEGYIAAVNPRINNKTAFIRLKMSPSIAGGFLRPTKWQRFKWWLKDNFL